MMFHYFVPDISPFCFEMSIISNLHDEDYNSSEDDDAEILTMNESFSGDSTITTGETCDGKKKLRKSSKNDRFEPYIRSRHRSKNSNDSFKAKKVENLSESELQELRMKINSRERKRMHDLNSALESLRQVMPYTGGPSSRKLSKISTLLLARNYIVNLTRSLDEMKRMMTKATSDAHDREKESRFEIDESESKSSPISKKIRVDRCCSANQDRESANVEKIDGPVRVFPNPGMPATSHFMDNDSHRNVVKFPTLQAPPTSAATALFPHGVFPPFFLPHPAMSHFLNLNRNLIPPAGPFLTGISSPSSLNLPF